MQGEYWLMIANSQQILFFADFLGREKYSFHKQHYEQMMPEVLRSHPCVGGFFTINPAVHLLKVRHEEITGANDVNLLSFKSNCLLVLKFFKVTVLAIQCVCNFS